MKLTAIRALAMSLPEVTEEPHHEFGSFRVKGKIFVTMPPGDEFIHVFVPEEVREPALQLHSNFLEKLMWGGKARGLRVTLSCADPRVVHQLVRSAWECKAPKSLVAKLPDAFG